MCLILCCLWAGCSSNEPLTGVRLEFKGVSDQTAIKGRIEATGIAEGETGHVEAGSVVFSEVLLGVTEIEFESEDNNDDGDDDADHDNSGPGDGDDGEDHDNSGPGNGDDDDGDNEEIEFEGEFLIDLIAGTSVPDFGIATIPPGIYEEIELTLSPILPDSNSVFIAFTFTSTMDDTVQVELSTKRKIEIEIEDDDGFQIDDNVLNNILVLIDLDKLLSGIDLSGAAADGDGVIRINDSSNTEILLHILSNFNDFCHGGEDNDHDGDIDD